MLVAIKRIARASTGQVKQAGLLRRGPRQAILGHTRTAVVCLQSWNLASPRGPECLSARAPKSLIFIVHQSANTSRFAPEAAELQDYSSVPDLPSKKKRCEQFALRPVGLSGCSIVICR